MKFNSRGDRENLIVLLQQFRVDSSELSFGPYELVLFDGIDDHKNTYSWGITHMYMYMHIDKHVMMHQTF